MSLTAPIHEIVDSIASRRLVILAGAGISFAPPASAPLFRPLRDTILQALTKSLDAELSPGLRDTCQSLFNAAKYPRSPHEPPPEVLFEGLHQILRDVFFDLLRTLLDTPYPNSQHAFVAQLAGTSLPLLITTNLSRLRFTSWGSSLSTIRTISLSVDSSSRKRLKSPANSIMIANN